MSNLKDFLGHVHAICDAFIPPVIDNAFHSAFPFLSLPPYCKPAQNQHIPGCRCNIQSQQWPNNQQRPYAFLDQTNNNQVPMTSIPVQSFNPNMGYNPNIRYNPNAANTMTYRGPNGGPMTNKPNQSFNPNMGYNPNIGYNPSAAYTMNNYD